MFMIWGLNQNADKKWIRGLVGEASHGWVQHWVDSKNTKAAPSSYSSEAEEYKRVNQAQAWCLLRNMLLFWRSREQQLHIPTTHSAVLSCHIFHSIPLSSRWTHNLSPPLRRFWPSLYLKWYHLCVIPYKMRYTQFCASSSHHTTNKYLNTTREKRQKTCATFGDTHFRTPSRGWVGCCEAWRPGAILVCAHLSY